MPSSPSVAVLHEFALPCLASFVDCKGSDDEASDGVEPGGAGEREQANAEQRRDASTQIFVSAAASARIKLSLRRRHFIAARIGITTRDRAKIAIANIEVSGISPVARLRMPSTVT
jgi:hypothetical protein